MADWFAPKRYGLGAGLPICWQGWAAILFYVAIMMRGIAARGAQPLGLRIDLNYRDGDLPSCRRENDARRLALALGRERMTITLMLAVLLAGAAVERPITTPGPQGPLAGTLLDAGKGAPVVLIIPGSGPTDRDGNNAMGVAAAPYRLLAEALAARGISSVRIDKRGMFGSKVAIANPNQVTIADYAADAQAWAASIRKRSGVPCVWLLGHSEGGLIALAAGQRPAGLCGVITVSGPGRKLGDVIREQLRGNPGNAPILDVALATLAKLEAGQSVDSVTLPQALPPLFYNDVQPFLRDLLSHDPARLAASLALPLLVVQGDGDLQVTVEDARRLAAAQPKAQLAILPGVNHVLKVPATTGRAGNLAAYADPELPLAPSVTEAIAGFVKP